MHLTYDEAIMADLRAELDTITRVLDEVGWPDGDLPDGTTITRADAIKAMAANEDFWCALSGNHKRRIKELEAENHTLIVANSEQGVTIGRLERKANGEEKQRWEEYKRWKEADDQLTAVANALIDADVFNNQQALAALVVKLTAQRDEAQQENAALRDRVQGFVHACKHVLDTTAAYDCARGGSDTDLTVALEYVMMALTPAEFAAPQGDDPFAPYHVVDADPLPFAAPVVSDHAPDDGEIAPFGLVLP